MADYDYNADDVDAEEEGFEREFIPTRDNVIFLIDVQHSMFEGAGLKDTEGFEESDTWFDVALRVAREFLKMHIISSDSDKIAIAFYGTRVTQNANNFENVYTLQDLDEPTAQRIRDLDSIREQEFEERVGSAPEKSPDHLKNGLWAAQQLLNSGSSKAYKRLIVARATTLHEANVTVEVFPLIKPERSFAMGFWNHIVHAGEDAETGTSFSEGADTLYRLQSLPGLLRHRGYRKRTAGRARLVFPEGFQLAVAMYALIQPATKSSPVYLHAVKNEPLRIESALICQDTGAILTEVPKRMFPKKADAEKLAGRIPPVVISTQELRELKIVKDPGLYLLGFKARSCLRSWHTWRQSTFVYPDEHSMPGSTTAFIALHEAMLQADRIAVCTYVRTRNSEPRLVALMAAQEEKDDYGEQVAPPGMHMLHLCFADDIRTPESDPNLVGTSFPEASEDQIAAAEAMIDKLSMGDSAYVGMFQNPMLQRHYQVLEALALGELPPEFEDKLQPDIQGMQGVGGAAIDAFRTSVYGNSYDEPGFGAKRPTAGKKRPNPEEEAVLKEAMADFDYQGLAAKGTLGKLKVDELKKYLKANGLKLTGKKDELIQRITEHIEKGKA
ncbi:ATP-dependent DNA helicase ii [Coccomyxa subellipsoidea C-169]|uniref:ATP-dependent DNA helicase ii n=1 Tax=Coccomyxa subellipsoidea (strain C-169) TaxID=574566 RepID=I0YW72_COCSC|nr:ATP-dependent DNA helicase ii [Coccomyxa subellipsoidea C-169]EIE22641.1 ATP-dependent DNA helicase ii [Coccomyxa subellipsoidea C-169]|eukprot:XP_005647185.1 ATP-dependent DNA helicase ii [Coccomyxa subellipsoidea C-169]